MGTGLPAYYGFSSLLLSKVYPIPDQHPDRHARTLYLVCIPVAAAVAVDCVLGSYQAHTVCVLLGFRRNLLLAPNETGMLVFILAAAFLSSFFFFVMVITVVYGIAEHPPNLKYARLPPCPHTHLCLSCDSP